jgi:hypothetical protein
MFFTKRMTKLSNTDVAFTNLIEDIQLRKVAIKHELFDFTSVRRDRKDLND